MVRGDGLIDVVVEFGIATSDFGKLEHALLSCSSCLANYRVKVLRWCVAVDATRGVLVCRAPDIESVRLVFRGLGVECDRIWACASEAGAGVAALNPVS